MKIKTTILATLTALAALTSCQNEENLTNTPAGNFPADRVIRVATRVATPATPDTPAGMTAEDITQFSLNVENPNDANYSYYSHFVKNTDQWDCFNGADDQGSTPLTMLWQNSTQPVTVTALASSNRLLTKSHFQDGSYSLNDDQRNHPNIKSADILYMPPTQVNPVTDLVNGHINVTFQHLMCHLQLRIIIGADLAPTPETPNPITNLAVGGTCRYFTFSAANNSDITLIENQEAKTTLPLATTYTPGTVATPGAEATPGTEATPGAVANYECILVPQTVAADTFTVIFEINGKPYTWTSPTPVALLRGNRHTLTLTVGNRQTRALRAGSQQVTLTDFSTSPWTEGTGGKLENN